MRRIVTAISAAALAFGLVSNALPANAAAGFDSAWAGQSDYLSSKPGDTVEVTAFFVNTGTTTWTKGTSTQVDLAACLDDKVTCNAQDASDADFNAGTWTSASRYSSGEFATRAPGQTQTFKFKLTVPLTKAAGTYFLNGALVVSATGGDVHNEGFYHQQVVTVTTTIAIASTTPASPSLNQTPVVNVTGAGNAQSVKIFDGTTQVGTGTSAADGTAAITTTSLADGSHSLTASATNQTSPAFTYVVDVTKPKLSSASALNLTQVTATFNENMACTSLTTSYTLRDIAGTTLNSTSPAGGGASQIAAAGTPIATGSTACLTATLTLTNAMTNGTQYTLTVVSGATDAAGNTIDTTANTATFVAGDTTAPTLTSAVYRSINVVRFTFSEPMNVTALGAGIINPANYTYDGTAGSAAFTCALISSTSADCTLTGGATFTSASHTFTAGNVQDTAGTTISPNPTSTSITFPPSTTRPTVASVTSPNLSQIRVTYSGRMASGAALDTATTTRCDANTRGQFTLLKGDGTSALPASLAAATFGACSATTFLQTITLAAGQTLVNGQSYQLTITAVTDPFGNVVSPSPGNYTFSAVGDTAAPTVSSVTTLTTTTTNPCTAAITGGALTTGPCNQTVFTVTFSEAMTNATVTPGAVYTTPITLATPANSQGVTIVSCVAGSTDGAAFTAAAATGATSVVCTLSAAIQAGSYTLSVNAGPTDISGNALAATTVTVSFVDTTRPTLTAATASDSATTNASTLTVTFSEAMSQAGGTAGTNSVTNPANYRVDTTLLSTTNTVSVICNSATACTAVTITLTGAAAASPVGATGSAHGITVTGVTDTGGNTVNPSPSSRGLITG